MCLSEAATCLLQKDRPRPDGASPGSTLRRIGGQIRTQDTPWAPRRGSRNGGRGTDKDFDEVPSSRQGSLRGTVLCRKTGGEESQNDVSQSTPEGHLPTYTPARRGGAWGPLETVPGSCGPTRVPVRGREREGEDFGGPT